MQASSSSAVSLDKVLVGKINNQQLNNDTVAFMDRLCMLAYLFDRENAHRQRKSVASS